MLDEARINFRRRLVNQRNASSITQRLSSTLRNRETAAELLPAHQAARRRKLGLFRTIERLVERVFHLRIALSRLTYEPTETKHRMLLHRTSYCSNCPTPSTVLSAAEPQKGHDNSCAFALFFGASFFAFVLVVMQD